MTVAVAASTLSPAGSRPAGATTAQAERPALAARAQAASSSSRVGRNAPAAALALRDGDAEARLLAVYRHVGEGDTAAALSAAEALVRVYPQFQLGQLIYGDLLSLRIRPVRAPGELPADAGAGANPSTLPALRQESLLRLRALRERPPPGTVPSQFVGVAAANRHAIAIDTSRARLYLFENTGAGLTLLADYYISVGRLGTEKSSEGDLRTPLGVYFVTGSLDPRLLKPFYGAGALPINYPNPYDIRRGRTGGGIWLHGTPQDQFARAPLATDGCVVLANPDLRRIIQTVEVRSTPVVIAERLQWVPPQAARATAKVFEETFAAWRHAKASADLPRTLEFYAADFNSYGKTLVDWTQVVQQDMARARGRALQTKDLSYLRWQDGNSEIMVATFGEVPDGARTGPVRRQYWLQTRGQWKIFFEGTIG